MAAIGEEGQQLQLTDLPDEILIRILSLLPTETAVKTCLLLSGWQHHLWKSLTTLAFIDKTQNHGFRRTEFINFVDRIMNLRDQSANLESFSLECYMEIDYVNCIKTWITKAVQCNVKDLTLSIMEYVEIVNTPYSTPYCCIFGCQSLVKLDLSSITFNVHSSVICLPRLKFLRLSCVKLKDDRSTEKLLSSPLLEELIIDRCFWYIRSIYVRSPNLQVLKLSDCDCSDYYSTEICIVGNNLKYFCYKGNLRKKYQIRTSAQLTKAELYVKEEITKDRSGLNCYEILKGLSKTRNLALSDYFLKGLQNFRQLLDTIPLFDCVTQLDIRVNKEKIYIDSLALMKIFERCPRMECLDIEKLSHVVMRSPQLKPIPLCFQTHLKKIMVHYYVPGDESDAALDVLLNSALVLEELVIYCKLDKDIYFHEGGRKIQKLQNRLIRRPRISKDCIVSVNVTYADK